MPLIWRIRPDYFFNTTSLAPYLDQKLLFLLRDGRNFIGTMRSFDEHGSLVLEGTYERIIVGNVYCDNPMGLFIIGGENVTVIGELDFTTPELPPHMTAVSLPEIRAAIRKQKESHRYLQKP